MKDERRGVDTHLLFQFPLFAEYMTAHPDKGLAFGQEILKALDKKKAEPNSKAAQAAEPNRTTWKTNVDYAQMSV